MIKRLRVTVDGHTYDVTVEMADEQPAQAAPLSAPPPLPAAPPPISPPSASPPPAPAPSAPTPGPTTPGDVPSPLAGRVTAIVVAAGQSVKEGDHLLTLEAMKMNTFVFAPKSGSVAEIKAAVGDAVEEHQVLMRIA
ncbi:MAG TPA: biotin/lipoyl-containing protein [Verrucomicrobiae bacterium]|nr:biotin/lipoyl-containing protein [Verrucomicrobiae bacterium]